MSLRLRLPRVFQALIADVPVSRPDRRPGRGADERTAIGLLLPALIPIAVFTVIPIVFSLWLSLYRWDMMRPNRAFVGLDNFQRLIADDRFLNAVRTTLLYAAFTVPISIVLGFFAALLLNRKLRGRSVFRTAFFAPVVTSTVAISFVWTWIYQPEIGLLNALLENTPVGAVGWLRDPNIAVFAIGIMSIWKNVGYLMVLFLAGMQNIPDDLFGAARIDGASRWRLQRDITIPLLKPTFFFVIVTSTIDATQVFTQIDVMTQGGPARSTEVLAYYLYFRAFRSFEMGYASAIAWALFVLIVGLTLIQSLLVRREDAAV